VSTLVLPKFVDLPKELVVGFPHRVSPADGLHLHIHATL